MTSSLKTMIKNHNKVLAIYGLGNVGGAIAASWLKNGAKIIGVDIISVSSSLSTRVIILSMMFETFDDSSTTSFKIPSSAK